MIPARHADHAEAAVLPHGQPVAEPERGGMVPGRSAEAREPVPALEEGGVGLLEPAQHLLQGGE
ncbi:hypothetical protein QO001_005687 [Methylobacterium brachiatum]|uniref:Uncharacterized protein n=1 Tax=Methylobacterium brachiatum TaxID=269660 RepID=A0AAJ1WZX6_9HYPH|nr:hypothetical protein [Methylobacterium brachiatum]MCB4805605.1 hypothetical protein [Methylobacterium brachiatum]MDQ0546735.1 hypothetical protein [Methylobacterium brachiatum]